MVAPDFLRDRRGHERRFDGLRDMVGRIPCVAERQPSLQSSAESSVALIRRIGARAVQLTSLEIVLDSLEELLERGCRHRRYGNRIVVTRERARLKCGYRRAGLSSPTCL